MIIEIHWKLFFWKPQPINIKYIRAKSFIENIQIQIKQNHLNDNHLQKKKKMFVINRRQFDFKIIAIIYCLKK